VEDGDGDGLRGCEGDCDDSDGDIYPGATEICNGLDDDCDRRIDDAGSRTWYRDADGDGLGSCDEALRACLPGCEVPGWSMITGDCDDASAQIPGPGGGACCEVDALICDLPFRQAGLLGGRGSSWE
ncbi:MAG: putative metal-binding motif-containing protein, partial [Myxococcales bacterium]|nr:putative metal-binding motif-containing protein [Myxococcales bacterium]